MVKNPGAKFIKPNGEERDMNGKIIKKGAPAKKKKKIIPDIETNMGPENWAKAYGR